MYGTGNELNVGRIDGFELEGAIVGMVEVASTQETGASTVGGENGRTSRLIYPGNFRLDRLTFLTGLTGLRRRQKTAT